MEQIIDNNCTYCLGVLPPRLTIVLYQQFHLKPIRPGRRQVSTLLSAVLSIVILTDLQLQGIEKRLPGGQQLSWDGDIGVQPGTLICAPSFVTGLSHQLLTLACWLRHFDRFLIAWSQAPPPMAAHATSAKGVYTFYRSTYVVCQSLCVESGLRCGESSRGLMRVVES